MANDGFDRTPPPFFRQGPSALSMMMFCSALAVFLMVADARFHVTQPLRAVLATALLPIERALRVPVLAWQQAQDYLSGLQAAIRREHAAQAELARQAERGLRVERLEHDNANLRSLLGLRPALAVRSTAAEVLYDAPDIYSRKVIIDRGRTDGIVPGSPVIDAAGVLGQVTRVYPLSAEVTLLTDKDAAIPVLNARTQVRGAVFGRPGGAGMELRFMAGNADVQVGDLLTTSGVDGVYPPGLPVARVSEVERRAETSFARVGLQPVASPEGVRQVLVLEPIGVQLAPHPEPAAPAASAAPPARPGPR